jgi:hypothetical protein
MATDGPLYTGTGANANDGGTTAWATPTSVQGDTTGTAATFNTATTAGTSQRLRASNFGFSIPTNATIDGITVEVEQVAANASRHRWRTDGANLLIGGTEAGSSLGDTSAISNSKGFKTFGSATELWGLTPTPAQVNATGFGFSMKIERYGTATTTSISRIRITVDYSLPSSEITGAFSADAIALREQSAAIFNATSIVLVSVEGAFGANAAAVKNEAIDRCVWTTPPDMEPIPDLKPSLAFLSPESVRHQHFEMHLDINGSFNTQDLYVYRSFPDPSGWEFFDGVDWELLPPTGLDPDDAGAEIRFTVPIPLTPGIWYRRARATT